MNVLRSCRFTFGIGGLMFAAGAAALGAFDPSHAAWTSLLKKHVELIDDGREAVAFLDYDWNLSDARNRMRQWAARFR